MASENVPEKELQRAAEALAGATRLVVATGAGMSKESGIPTFRDAPDAFWANFNPEDLATPDGFLRNPPLVWRWYDERRRMIAAAAPHPGHFAVAELEGMFDEFLLMTQNIDNLHRRAGSRRLVELHGNIFRHKCFENEHPVDELPAGDDVPPRCHCGSMIRPDVVWFGELLDAGDLDMAFEALALCDAMLVVGTSGLIYPAAGFPAVAKQAGATVIEVNPEETAVTGDAHMFVPATAGEALPEIVRRVRELRSA